MTNVLDLSGDWLLYKDNVLSETPLQATIPGDNYSTLLRYKLIDDPFYGCNENKIQEFSKAKWCYTRKFSVDKTLLESNFIYLNLEMVDTFADIYINQQLVCSTKNAFARYTPEIKNSLVAGENSITIIIHPPEAEGAKIAEQIKFKVPQSNNLTAQNLNYIRKTHCHGGWDWGITMMVAGVYKAITIHATNLERIDFLYTEQLHSDNHCQVKAIAEIFAYDSQANFRVKFHFAGQTAEKIVDIKKGNNSIEAVFEVENPALWWPRGYGKQTLYELKVTTKNDSQTRAIGLRNLEIINTPDQYGKSMTFRVNNTDIFCKGANWIPADAFPERQTYEKIQSLLEDACHANMNMIRVWGGGQYEHDFFYNLCDEMGLLVWQDMMFACSLYPSENIFSDNVTEELRFQMKRLHHHPSLAIWCGDNEVLNATSWYDKERRIEFLVNYDRLNRKLAEVAEECDKTRTFWPSSPCAGENDFSDTMHSDGKGDMHYWAVWFGDREFSAFQSINARFCSEFGFQSFPSLETVSTYCPEDEYNVFSKTMDHHQKCPKGNTTIINMFSRNFRMPNGFENLLYLSQVQHALAIKTGVEYWRSIKGICMGTIYWQLNDNWPVASWSSIEYCGKWKHLHYHATRFFAPLLAMGYVEDDGTCKISVISDINEVIKVDLKIVAYNLDGESINERNEQIILDKLQPFALAPFPISEFISSQCDSSFIQLYATYTTANGITHNFENTIFWNRYKHCNLGDGKIDLKVTQKDGRYLCHISSDKVLFYTYLDVMGIKGRFSDNSFTVIPNHQYVVEFIPKEATTLEAINSKLTLKHLRQTY